MEGHFATLMPALSSRLDRTLGFVGVCVLTWVDVCADVNAGRLEFRSLGLGGATGSVIAEVQQVIESLGR